jgi:pimeloyl-ACP methyl ester carboxylesterase
MRMITAACFEQGSNHWDPRIGERMATVLVNGVQLFYELHGAAAVPLVLVHGSWDSHHNWNLVVPRLAEAFRVLTYDRRGHSQSERPTGQGNVREDVADLAALLEHLGLVPAWVVGNSFGASITLRLASEHPGLFRGLIVHEPPLFSLLANDPHLAPMLADVQRQIRAVVERIALGDHTGATEQFVETVALGPGTWATVPPDIQQVMIENAPTFLDEANDPEQLDFDLESISRFSKPVLLTLGDQSPPTFAPVVARLSGALPHAEIVTLQGAGHVPHETHPDAYVEAVIEFTRKHTA